MVNCNLRHTSTFTSTVISNNILNDTGKVLGANIKVVLHHIYTDKFRERKRVAEGTDGNNRACYTRAASYFAMKYPTVASAMPAP